MSYSQNNEEAVLLDYFGAKADGMLLEIGAFHPTRLSNTRALLERGWSGMLCDMSPFSLAQLVREVSLGLALMKTNKLDQLVSALAYLLMDHKQMFPEAHPNSTIRWEECEEVKRAAYAIEYASANRNLG